MQLSNNGIPVLVSTHSPYFVQGVRYFAAQQDAEKYVNYYLTENGEDGLAELKEVTDDFDINSEKEAIEDIAVKKVYTHCREFDAVISRISA